MIRSPSDCTPRARAIDSMETVARIMRDAGTDILPVTRDGRVVGIITARDIVTRMIAAGEDTWLARASDYMTCPVDTCSEDMSPREARRIMADKQRRMLPIVNANGELVGVLTSETADIIISLPSAALA